MINMIVVPCTARRKNLECGDKSRAVRGSRHRFLSAPCAETHLVPTLSRTHLVSTPSRLRQRRSVSTKCFGRSVPDEVYPTKCERRRDEVRLAVPLCAPFCRCTHAQKAASRGIPFAAALQFLLSDLQSRCRPVKTSASLRLCVFHEGYDEEK
jgi:hypothetical protein